MQCVELTDIEGVRWLPDQPSGVGALVLAGSSGRVESARAQLLARNGVVAESIRWFGGAGQHDGPWEIALELFIDRVEGLAERCDRVLVMGTSVDAVVAFAPTDLVWAGVGGDGSMTSHWTLHGLPLPYMRFDETWESEDEVPAFAGLYESSRRCFPELLEASTIPVERIQRLVPVAGGDDQVWPSLAMAESIRARRDARGLHTVLVTDPEGGHRTLLPGERVVKGGVHMRRGGSEVADRRLGAVAWHHIEELLERR
jgi:uncharacterized protein